MCSQSWGRPPAPELLVVNVRVPMKEFNTCFVKCGLEKFPETNQRQRGKKLNEKDFYTNSLDDIQHSINWNTGTRRQKMGAVGRLKKSS